MMALREIAKGHIAKCKEGDMRAIKELADRLDGRPAQILDLSDSDRKPIEKIVAGTRDRPSAFPLRPQLKKNAQGAAVEPCHGSPGNPRRSF
jgi:hypothetical protein